MKERCTFMAVTTFPAIEKLFPLVDLHIHQIAMKQFHYHCTASFPYNLLITVLDTDKDADDYFLNVKTGEKTILQAGHAYLLPCNTPVQFERTPAVTVVTMRFNLTFFYGLDIFDGHHDIEDLRAPGFAKLLGNLLGNRRGGGDHGAESVKSALLIKTEVSRLCLSCWPAQMKDLTPKMWKYEEVFVYVREYADASLTVSRLAELCGMRQDVFSRSFRRDLGISPKQYIADVLLRQISSYLLTSHLSVKEIARKLKFGSEYYLSRFFKKHTRLSPREFKRQFFDSPR